MLQHLEAGHQVERAGFGDQELAHILQVDESAVRSVYRIAEEAVPAEIFRFDTAIARAKQELAAIEAHVPGDAPHEFGAFINLHRMIRRGTAYGLYYTAVGVALLPASVLAGALWDRLGPRAMLAVDAAIALAAAVVFFFVGRSFNRTHGAAR